ncbi:GNAT family N-acetyltransferase [Paenibacillus sp. FA6]|uniref:GNAT family N-acetyltransferase n=1 Tax=Paenibacillus sp. FA6 TaxID=3413029 RepID=UPI003F65A520
MGVNQQTLTIRLSEMKDAQQIMDLDAVVWDDYSSPEPLDWTSREDFLRHCQPGSQFVALVDHRICGYVGFRYPTLIKSNRHVYEINIAVHPQYQHRGVGTSLMDMVKEWASEQGMKKLSLRVLASNSGALEFYEKCGFVREGQLINEFLVGGRYVDDILMGYLL